MKYIEDQKYTYQDKNGNFEVTFTGEEKDFCWFNCDKCGKEINHIFFFQDNEGSSYQLGSKCVKKIIKEIN